ncbi:MAG: hypothetical protein WC180_05290 [Candidatus Paceibacterota bacterium]|jgi:hypothetical protein
MTKQKLVAIVIVLLLICSNIFFAFKLNEEKRVSEQLRADLLAADAELPIIEFNQLFVDKVLRAEGEVSFETRLELENKVRDLNDAEMLEQWNRFVNASDEAEAQSEVKELLSLLAQRMND